MWRSIVMILFATFTTQVLALWDKETVCPNLCTCRLEHLTESAVYQFGVKDGIEKGKPSVVESITLEDNDVLYDETPFEFDESGFIKSATCIVQTETIVNELIFELPKDLQSITLLQASDSGNKSFKFSDLKTFRDIQIVDIQSAQEALIETQPDCYFHLEIDEALEKLQYLNLERVKLTNSKRRSQKLEEEVVIFEVSQKNQNGGHAITLVQKKSGENIVPYKYYVERMKSSQGPLFMGFSDLTLLRIYECELNHIHWEMFEGLLNLNSLILEKNGLRFISDFAFYGTPNLKSLSLARNHLLSIQITDLAGLLELEYLDLSYNNFTQLSELSLPPFPRLKLANFANNPITDVFPNTFEVMNTTDSLILGGFEEPLSLQRNSFIGLKTLRSLKLLHLDIPLFQREILLGLVSLQTLTMTGNIFEIQYDAFLETTNLDTLIISSCNLSKLSVDSFIGLNKLRTLDLSNNNLESLPPGIFDDLEGLNELYLSKNRFKQIPRDIFSKLNVKLIRLNDNPWHCSCDMSEWKPMIVNRIKQRTIKPCDRRLDKGIDCDNSNNVNNKSFYKYVYENRVAPKCVTPNKFKNWSVFHVMRRQYKCSEFKPKMKKKSSRKMLSIGQHEQSVDVSTTIISQETTQRNFQGVEKKLLKLQKYQKYVNKYNHHYDDDYNNEDNNLLI